MISAIQNLFRNVLVQHVWPQFAGGWQSVDYTLVWRTLHKVFKMRDNEEKGCCHRFCRPIKEEFRTEQFGLQHEQLDDFFKSQWQKSNKSYLWLIYRWCLAVCFSVGVVGSMVQQFSGGKWFIYLTNWGFSLCMYTSIFGAILVSIYFYNSTHFAENSRVVHIYWASHTVTLVTATVITFIYWIFIYPTDTSAATDLYNLWSHGFNSILMILDHMLVAFPTRILHVVYPIGVGIIYGVFTLIYYYAGGTNIDGYRYIYEILDYSHPALAAGTLGGCLVLLLIFMWITFALYRLRCYLCHRNSNSITISNA